MTCCTALAYADDPKFEYGKSDDLKDVKSVIWKAAAQAGFVFTSGNSHTTTITGGLVASRKEGDNKFSVEANAAYGKSQLRIAQDLDGNNLLSPDEIQTVNQQTTNNWLAKARYDRFLTAQNSVFVTARVGADQIAGKDLIFGYMGDDLQDVPVLRRAGFSAAPADAAPEVRAAVQWISESGGGRGAARECIEHVLRAQGRWRKAIAGFVES